MLGGSGNKAYCWIEFGGGGVARSEVLGLSNWLEETENDKMGLEVGLDGGGKAGLENSGNIVTVSAILEQR